MCTLQVIKLLIPNDEILCPNFIAVPWAIFLPLETVSTVVTKGHGLPHLCSLPQLQPFQKHWPVESKHGIISSLNNIYTVDEMGQLPCMKAHGKLDTQSVQIRTRNCATIVSAALVPHSRGNGPFSSPDILEKLCRIYWSHEYIRNHGPCKRAFQREYHSLKLPSDLVARSTCRQKS